MSSLMYEGLTPSTTTTTTSSANNLYCLLAIFIIS